MAFQRQARRGSGVRIAALSAVLAVSLSGCAGYDLELNGGVFEAMGVAGVVGKKQKEKNLAARPGLVVPPSTASLPAPGSAPRQQTADQAWPVDPETRKADAKRVALARHKAFCDVQRRRLESGMITVLPDGPMGSCHESIVKNLTGKDLFSSKPDPAKTQ